MFKRTTFLVPILFIMMSGITYAAPGDLDTTFNRPEGAVTYDGGIGRDYAAAVAIQSDGKIVVTGGSLTDAPPYDVLVLRYNADGSLDDSFGAGGVVTYDNGNEFGGWHLAIQADGKIVVTGHTIGNQNVLLLRYNADGSLDESFGTNGVVTYDSGSDHEQGRAVAIQSDGKIVIAGGSGTASDGDVLVFRYNADGSLDTAFGTDGVATYDGGSARDCAWAVAIQSDGKIIAAGERDNGSDQDVLVLRYDTAGSLDESFGANGIISYDSGGARDCAEAVAIQSDGKIVVAGWGEQYDVLLFRYNADGSLDESFGTDGVATYEGESGDCLGVAIQSDGKIVVAGGAYNGTDADVLVWRYNADGSLDTAFGTDGVATYDSGGGGEYATAVAIQSDGNIVVAGGSEYGADQDVVVLRLIGGENGATHPSYDDSVCFIATAAYEFRR